MDKKTYLLDFENGGVLGLCDKLDALKQTIFMILNTERYIYPVYSWDYGAELSESIGREISYLWPELKRRITEALLTDDRIRSVEDFSFDSERDKVTVNFKVRTVFGDINEKKEVIIYDV